MKKTFFITTAIDYVNASPHLGHALEKVQADVIARYFRNLGREVLFLIGTDENSLKNVRAAEGEGITPQELVDKNAKKFYQLKEVLNLSFDDFIRTTELRHKKGAQKLWLACKKDIYKKTYRGLYCGGCEEYYKEEELVNGLCPEHKTKPELVEEENYFFGLSKYQKKLIEIIEKDKIKIIPEIRKNEILTFLYRGLEDICISRSAKRARGWGIDVPGDPSQKIWVWFDALSNYINAVGYGTSQRKFKKWWPADVHVIGKGISRFHCIYWPAILISAKLPLPKAIFIHGYITLGGQKMSKSLGNIVDPFELVQKYGTDAVRYFLLRESSPFEDLDFTFEKFKKRYNSDLAAGIGNLVARVIGLMKKIQMGPSRRLGGWRAGWSPNSKFQIQDSKLKKEIKKTKSSWKEAFENFKLNEALISIWNLISSCDKFIQEKRPWEKGNEKIIPDLFYALEEISKMLNPFLPETSERILKQKENQKIKPLFPKI